MFTKKILKRYLSLSAAIFISVMITSSVGMLVVYNSVYAGTPPTEVPPAGTPPTEVPPAGTPPTGAATDFNALKGVGNICQLIDKLLNLVTQIGAIIGVMFIIYSGFLFVKAQGNQTELENAKKMLYTTLIGVGILLASSVIAKIILSTVNNVIQSKTGACSL